MAWSSGCDVPLGRSNLHPNCRSAYCTNIICVYPPKTVCCMMCNMISRHHDWLYIVSALSSWIESALCRMSLTWWLIITHAITGATESRGTVISEYSVNLACMFQLNIATPVIVACEYVFDYPRSGSFIKVWLPNTRASTLDWLVDWLIDCMATFLCRPLRLYSCRHKNVDRKIDREWSMIQAIDDVDRIVFSPADSDPLSWTIIIGLLYQPMLHNNQSAQRKDRLRLCSVRHKSCSRRIVISVCIRIFVHCILIKMMTIWGWWSHQLLLR